MRPYWLFCAGEDSGDVLGESLVQEILEKGFDALGAGGRRMEGAGLLPLVPFDDLPVNGFGDVLLHSHRLAKNFKILRRALQNENCHGLVAVDYPGFNLKLMQLALQMEKRVIYVEPPQIWAWKPKRVQAFLSPEAKRLVELRALYDIEIEAYQKFGLHVQKIPHPLLQKRNSFAEENFSLTAKDRATAPILLFPGSRLSQAKRNLELYRRLADKLTSKGQNVVFVASRTELFRFLEGKFCGKFRVQISPQSAEERFALLQSAKCVVSGPGSAMMEAFLAKTPCVAASRIEPLTFCVGKLFLKTKHLTLPNIQADRLQKEASIPEYVQSVFSNVDAQAAKVFYAVEKFIFF